MSDLRDQLIRLGSTNPELRAHLRPILAALQGSEKVASNLANLIADYAFEAMEFADEHLFEYGSRSDGRRAVQKMVEKALKDPQIKEIVDRLYHRQLPQFGYDLYFGVQGHETAFWDGDWDGILTDDEIKYLGNWTRRHGEIYL